MEIEHLNEWINVKDRAVPLMDVLIISKNHGIQKVWWNQEFERFQVGGWQSCCYCGGENEIELDDVTHWMSLPELIIK